MEGLSRHRETGQRIRRLRLTTGLSQERFAPKVGVTRRHLIRLENGEHRPGRDLAARIERVVEDITGNPVKERILSDDEEESSLLFDALLDALLDRALERRAARERAAA